jgi:hypothetical protein
VAIRTPASQQGFRGRGASRGASRGADGRSGGSGPRRRAGCEPCEGGGDGDLESSGRSSLQALGQNQKMLENGVSVRWYGSGEQTGGLGEGDDE